MNITMTHEQYVALVTLAQRGTTNPLQLDRFVRQIEEDNGIHRSTICIRWQEAHVPLPPGLDFPTEWPAKQQSSLTRYDRPIARADVDAEVRRLAKHPTLVMVTQDVQGKFGWTKLEEFF